MALINGNDYGETLTGSTGTDTIDAKGGNDYVDMLTGRGHAYGGTGIDTLAIDFALEPAAVWFSGGYGWAKSAGSEILYQSQFDSFKISGTAYNDSIAGAAADDTLYGGAGNDSINMGQGRGLASGGDGSDTLTADFSLETAGVTFSAGAANVMSAGTVVMQQSGFETFNITGTDYADLIATAAGNDYVSAGLGNDRVNVGTGRGYAYGGDGMDTLVANFGAEGSGVIFSAGYGWVKNSTADIFYQSQFESFVVTGTAYADNMTGGTYDDTLLGGAGNDVINMGKGRGIADGGGGNNTLVADFSGEAGAVQFNAAVAAVTSGAATVLTQSNFGTFNLTGTAGNDVLVAAAGNDVLYGGGGNDRLDMGTGRGSAYGGDGNDKLVANFGAEGSGVNFSAFSGWVKNGTTDIFYHTQIENFDITGTAYADNMTGGAYDDTLRGGAGNDVINMGKGRGIADGGAGANTLVADFSGEPVAVQFNAATAAITSGAATVLTQSNFGTFNLTGTAGNDVMVAGAGNDSLYGGGGNDRLNMGAGGGHAYGGNGATTPDTDTLVADFSTQSAGVNFNANYGWVPVGGTNILYHSQFEVFDIKGTSVADVIAGGAAADTLRGLDGDDDIDMRTGRGTADGGIGTDILRADFSSETGALVFNAVASTVRAGGVAVMTQTGFEKFALTGTAGNDTIITGASDDTVYGGLGNDIVNMARGRGYAYGGDGIDRLVVDFGAETAGVTFSAFSGWANNGTTDIFYHTQFENYVVTGTAAADNLTGGDMDDTLSGANGNDSINMAKGRGVANGGTGFDILRADFSGELAAVNFNAGATAATMGTTTVLTHAGFEVFNITGTSGGDTLIGAAGNDTLDGGLGNDRIDMKRGRGHVYGGNGVDTLLMDFGAETKGVSFNAGYGWINSGGADITYHTGFEKFSILGSGLADTFLGGADNDTLGAASGNDSLWGNTGNDRLDGGIGNDTLDGGTGNDIMVGGAGDDTYIVDAAGDVVSEPVDAGTDTIRSSVSRALAANQENLVLTGSAAINGTGNAFANTITGNDATNSLQGLAGNDKLLGGGGNDVLLGASTAAPYGALEIDTLTGGTGNDIFKLCIAAGRLYDDNNAVTAGLAGYALVTDFTAGDKLQLKGATAQYRLGASPVGLPAGQGLFHDSNANGILNAGDELIAVVQGPNAANALLGAVVV